MIIFLKDDYEREIKEMYMKKFSFAIPFRQDPMNKKIEKVSNMDQLAKEK